MTNETDAPEPPGYVNCPGFVKSNPLNNESYLARSKEAYPEWADVLQETHDKLTELVPEYNIAQIKEKFWCLRYYIDLPIGTDPEISEKAYAIANEAEDKARPLK